MCIPRPSLSLRPLAPPSRPTLSPRPLALPCIPAIQHRSPAPIAPPACLRRPTACLRRPTAALSLNLASPASRVQNSAACFVGWNCVFLPATHLCNYRISSVQSPREFFYTHRPHHVAITVRFILPETFLLIKMPVRTLLKDRPPCHIEPQLLPSRQDFEKLGTRFLLHASSLARATAAWSLSLRTLSQICSSLAANSATLINVMTVLLSPQATHTIPGGVDLVTMFPASDWLTGWHRTLHSTLNSKP